MNSDFGNARLPVGARARRALYRTVTLLTRHTLSLLSNVALVFATLPRGSVRGMAE
jgi:hypothetical protein